MFENKETSDTKTEKDDPLSQAIIASQNAAHAASMAYYMAYTAYSNAQLARQKAAHAAYMAYYMAYKAYSKAQITISNLEAWTYTEIKEFLCESADMEVKHRIRSNRGPSESSHQTPQAPIERLARLHQKKKECADLSSARLKRFFASQ